MCVLFVLWGRANCCCSFFVDQKQTLITTENDNKNIYFSHYLAKFLFARIRFSVGGFSALCVFGVRMCRVRIL